MFAAFHRFFGCLFGTQTCVKNKSAAIYPIDNNDPLNKTNYLLLENTRSGRRHTKNSEFDKDTCESCFFLFCYNNEDLDLINI